jgi:hypothetical protein
MGNQLCQPNLSKGETLVAKKPHPEPSLQIDFQSGRLKAIQELAKAIHALASPGGMPSPDTIRKLATIHIALVAAREEIEAL